MPKSYAFLMAALSVAGAALVIGWVNDLDYWQRIRAIGVEFTRPPAAKADAAAHEVAEPASLQGIKDSPAPTVHRAEKPSDRETADGWVSWAKATRERDPQWMPPVYANLAAVKSVQSCVIEFRVIQIEDANARIVFHQGERLWLTGGISGLAVNKAYSCKGLFAPTGTYQFKTADGTQTLAAYRYLGETPDLFAPAR